MEESGPTVIVPNYVSRFIFDLGLFDFPEKFGWPIQPQIIVSNFCVHLLSIYGYNIPLSFANEPVTDMICFAKSFLKTIMLIAVKIVSFFLRTFIYELSLYLIY